MLINCAECNNVISNMAEQCPHCGMPLQVKNQIIYHQPHSKEKKDYSDSISNTIFGCLGRVVFFIIFWLAVAIALLYFLL